MIDIKDVFPYAWHYRNMKGIGKVPVQLEPELIGKIFSEDLSVALNDFEPIPLTVEVLLASGFAKHNNSNEYWIFWFLESGFYINQAHHSEPSAGVVSGLFYWGDNYKEIRSLHQLMSLHFALHEKELTYKP